MEMTRLCRLAIRTSKLLGSAFDIKILDRYEQKLVELERGDMATLQRFGGHNQHLPPTLPGDDSEKYTSMAPDTTPPLSGEGMDNLPPISHCDQELHDEMLDADIGNENADLADHWFGLDYAPGERERLVDLDSLYY